MGDVLHIYIYRPYDPYGGRATRLPEGILLEQSFYNYYHSTRCCSLWRQDWPAIILHLSRERDPHRKSQYIGIAQLFSSLTTHTRLLPNYVIEAPHRMVVLVSISLGFVPGEPRLRNLVQVVAIPSCMYGGWIDDGCRASQLSHSQQSSGPVV